MFPNKDTDARVRDLGTDPEIRSKVRSRNYEEWPPNATEWDGGMKRKSNVSGRDMK
jgi:hypothetical protein